MLYTDQILGIRLSIDPNVFVPDPAVTDVLIAAYLSPNSQLQADIKGKRVLEPCTGSGIIAIATAYLGAARVTSSDVDTLSVACALHNTAQAGLAGRISLEPADGMPRHDGEQVFITNPPWFDNEEADDEPTFVRRCLADPGRKLLRRLFRQASEHDMQTGYVFVGTDDPFSRNGAIIPFDGWRSVQRWRIDNISLHRLTRV